MANVFVLSVLGARQLMQESDISVERDRGERCALPVPVALRNPLHRLYQFSHTAGEPDHVFVEPVHQLPPLLSLRRERLSPYVQRAVGWLLLPSCRQHRVPYRPVW